VINEMHGEFVLEKIDQAHTGYVSSEFSDILSQDKNITETVHRYGYRQR
jgi:hypothetical protein